MPWDHGPVPGWGLRSGTVLLRRTSRWLVLAWHSSGHIAPPAGPAPRGPPATPGCWGSQPWARTGVPSHLCPVPHDAACRGRGAVGRGGAVANWRCRKAEPTGDPWGRGGKHRNPHYKPGFIPICPQGGCPPAPTAPHGVTGSAYHRRGTNAGRSGGGAGAGPAGAVPVLAAGLQWDPIVVPEAGRRGPGRCWRHGAAHAPARGSR